MTTRDRRNLVTVRAVAVTLLLVALALLLAPPAAQAHAELIGSDPAAGAVVAQAPDHATLRFDEAVTLDGGQVLAFDAAGRRLEAPATVRDTTVTVDLPERLVEGTYSLVWHLVSVDGHRVAGSLSFSVGRPSRTVMAPALPAGSPRSVTALLAANQALLYLGLFTAAGVAIFSTWVVTARPVPRRRSLRRTAWGAALLSVMGGVLTVPLTVLQQRAEGLDGLVSAETWTGGGRELHLGLAAVATGLVLAVATLARLGRSPLRVVRTLAAFTVLVPACGLALTGHSRGASPAALVMAVDALHVVAGSIWVGGLAGLLVILPRSKPADRTATLTRFSALAAGSVALLALTGTLMAWRVAGTWDLLGSAYGRILLAKVDLVLVALTWAAVNRRLVRSGETAGVGREVRVEGALLVAVLALTAVLVNQSPHVARTMPDQRTVAVSR